MSMEHIFRNLNDIRVFDAMIEFTEECPVDTYDILDMLDFTDREYIQILDSIDHLIRVRILAIKLVPEEVTTGCPECKNAKESGLPIPDGHTNHKPEVTETIEMEKYYFNNNKLNSLLVSAVVAHSFDEGNEILKAKGLEPIKDDNISINSS